MKSAALAATLLFLTLNGSCRVDGGPAAAEAAQKEPEVDPRLQGVPAAHHALITQLEKDEPRMMDSWFELLELNAELIRCSTVFGLRERKHARDQIPKLESKIATERTKFYRAYDKVRDPIEKEEGKLKDRAMKLAETAKPDDTLLNKRIDELYAQTYDLSITLNGLKTLESVFAHAPKAPDDLELIGFNAHDSIMRDVAAENPDLIEARLTIMDCEADLAELVELKAVAEKDPKARWGRSDESKIERIQGYMDRAVEALAREVERAKRPFARDAEKSKKKLEDTQDKIADMEKHKRNTTSYYQRLSEYAAELERAEKAVVLLDKLAQWKKPEKKK
ncbi:MAG: hypothetical protein HQ523_08140 [Lentisphaerae bacterium]|nr:hypothetical protein [Lentisphaerota bacterium]